jgi:hypothetical protein
MRVSAIFTTLAIGSAFTMPIVEDLSGPRDIGSPILTPREVASKRFCPVNKVDALRNSGIDILI